MSHFEQFSPILLDSSISLTGAELPGNPPIFSTHQK